MVNIKVLCYVDFDLQWQIISSLTTLCMKHLNTGAERHLLFLFCQRDYIGNVKQPIYFTSHLKFSILCQVSSSLSGKTRTQYWSLHIHSESTLTPVDVYSCDLTSDLTISCASSWYNLQSIQPENQLSTHCRIPTMWYQLNSTELNMPISCVRFHFRIVLLLDSLAITATLCLTSMMSSSAQHAHRQLNKKGRRTWYRNCPLHPPPPPHCPTKCCCDTCTQWWKSRGSYFLWCHDFYFMQLLCCLYTI